MMYNADFLIAAVVILLLVLRNFLDQKRAEDLNKMFSPFLFIKYGKWSPKKTIVVGVSNSHIF